MVPISITDTIRLIRVIRSGTWIGTSRIIHKAELIVTIRSRECFDQVGDIPQLACLKRAVEVALDGHPVVVEAICCTVLHTFTGVVVAVVVEEEEGVRLYELDI